MSGHDSYRLRLIEEADLEKMLEWRNSERIRAVMFNDQLIPMDDHRAWFERLKLEKNAICLIFEIKGTPVGVVNVVQIDKRNSRCFWGFYLGETGTPAGSGSVMGYCALEYIFEVLGFQKLCAEVLASNLKSIEFHKKLGFIEEGIFVKHVLKNNKYEDVIAMAHFNEKWIKIKGRLKNHYF